MLALSDSSAPRALNSVIKLILIHCCNIGLSMPNICFTVFLYTSHSFRKLFTSSGRREPNIGLSLILSSRALRCSSNSFNCSLCISKLNCCAFSESSDNPGTRAPSPAASTFSSLWTVVSASALSTLSTFCSSVGPALSPTSTVVFSDVLISSL